jgi:hypothetical protein
MKLLDVVKLYLRCVLSFALKMRHFLMARSTAAEAMPVVFTAVEKLEKLAIGRAGRGTEASAAVACGPA